MAEVSTARALPPALSDQVGAWVNEVTAADGIRPFNDLGMRIVTGQRPGQVIWLIEAGQWCGLGLIDPADDSAQLAISPAARRRGLGRSLAAAIAAEQPRSWWSFGTLPGAVAVATDLGLAPARQLFKMVRSLATHPTTAPTLPDGVLLRPFSANPAGPGSDADELVRVNARTFAHHPEQGALTVADLSQIQSEPWFDADDLLLAFSTATPAAPLMGYHWMKREPDHPHEGEVYVLGVDPDFERRGLGRFLLEAGLHHLAERGVDRVGLFVEASNDRVVQLYTAAHFEIELRDTAWAAADSVSPATQPEDPR